MASAAQRWASELAGWAIPEHIVAHAPESPWALSPELFRPAARHAGGDRPSRRRALEVLDAGGTVLDVGCGAGAAGLALVPPAAAVVGVDERPAMLERFVAEAAAAGVAATAVLGRWPDVAGSVPVADVVVCHHVAYNVADLVPFALALAGRARRRVVLELTEAHPWAGMGRWYEHFWGIGRPAGPTAELAAEVLEEAGLAVRSEHSTAEPVDVAWPERVATVRRRLCLGAERDAEVAALLALDGPPAPRRLVTLWWDR